MKPDEIEKLARDGKPLPEFTTLPDACYYDAMQMLWERVRKGLHREQAHAEKMKIRRKYAEFKACYDNACAVYREQQNNIRHIGDLRTRITREPDERERLRLAIRAIGAMTGDVVFEKTQIKRLEEAYDNPEP
jgi:hypothetical protein